MNCQPGWLFFLPDETTTLKLKSGYAHISGCFLRENAVVPILPTGVILISVIQSSFIEFQPSPAIKYYVPGGDQVFAKVVDIARKLPFLSRNEILLFNCHTPELFLESLTQLQSYGINPILVDFSEQIIPNCIYISKQSFQADLPLFNPLVYPNLQHLKQRLLDLALELNERANSCIEESVVVIALPAIEEEFENLQFFQQESDEIEKMLKITLKDYDVIKFTDCSYFGQQSEMVYNSIDSFTYTEMSLSLQKKILRKYFYGADEKLTPKSVEVPREKVEFVQLQKGDLIEVDSGNEFTYGCIISNNSENIQAIVKIQQVTDKAVQIVVCNREILDYDVIKILKSNIDCL